MIHESIKRVRFAHCDPAGIVFYPRYVELINEVVEDWFEEGIGVDFHSLHVEHGLAIPTVRLEVEYLVPSRYGNILCFHLWVANIGNSSLQLGINAYSEKQLRMRARLKIVMTSLAELKPIPIPEEFWKPKFAAYLEPSA